MSISQPFLVRTQKHLDTVRPIGFLGFETNGQKIGLYHLYIYSDSQKHESSCLLRDRFFCISTEAEKPDLADI